MYLFVVYWFYIVKGAMNYPCIAGDTVLYIGTFVNGLRHGKGEETSKVMSESGLTEAHYNGEWLNDKMHGKGMSTYSCSEWKETYVGKFAIVVLV